MHTQLLEQLPARIREDGEGAVVRKGLVMLDDLRLAAADDDDACGCRDAEVLAHGDAVGQGLEVGLTGAAVEVPHEDDELALVGRVCGIVEAAEGTRRAFCIVDGDVIDGCQGRSIGAFVGVVDRQVGVALTSYEPVVGIGVLKLGRCACFPCARSGVGDRGGRSGGGTVCRYYRGFGGMAPVGFSR